MLNPCSPVKKYVMVDHDNSNNIWHPLKSILRAGIMILKVVRLPQKWVLARGRKYLNSLF